MNVVKYILMAVYAVVCVALIALILNNKTEKLAHVHSKINSNKNPIYNLCDYFIYFFFK